MTATAALSQKLPHAEEYERAARSRVRRLILFGLLIGLALAVNLTFGIQNLAATTAVLFVVVGLGASIAYPRVAFYVTFAAVCLLELFPTGAKDALTDQIPFFWNFNTLMQRYAHSDFKAIPLNMLELYLLFVGAGSLFRAVLSRNVGLKTGPLFLPICGYITFVVMAWGNGMATGGDFKISLAEVRSQFYFLAAYLMAVNLIRERKQVRGLMITMAVCIGVKGLLYTFRRYVTMAGMPLPDQGVGSHEEAFFFDCFVVLLLALRTFGLHRRLQWGMLALLPLVVTGNLATNRRAGTAAIAIALPLLFLAADRALPQRRKMIRITAAVLGICFLIYYQTFKNSESMFAQPARAVQSMFQPSARDASSNAYRDAENADLMATVHVAPLQGYGYGKRMLHAVKIADISSDYEWWDVMTHNQILWVWMRVGTFGFFAFWMMVAAILVQACRLLRDERSDRFIQATAAFTLLVVSMLMIFGLLDLQLSNFRDMMFAGFWSGILAILPQLTPTPAEATKEGRI